MTATASTPLCGPITTTVPKATATAELISSRSLTSTAANSRPT